MIEELLRTVGPLLLALGSAALFDRLAERKGLLPPGFRAPLDLAPDAATPIAAAAALAARRLARIRRGLGLAILASIFWVGIFLQLGALGRMSEIDVSDLEIPSLFLLHGLLVLAVAAWYVVGFAGTGRPRRGWAAQLGLRARHPWRELAIGLLVGVGAWLFVLAVLVGFGVLLWQVGMEELLPTAPPAIVPWIAGLPLAVRIGVSLSAGVVEETFFRGFLQPRLGILLSTLLFALAHLSYDQPIMLVGVTLLSLIYGLLVRWRQSVIAAIAAHALFDGIQLVVVIPAALRFLGPPA